MAYNTRKSVIKNLAEQLENTSLNEDFSESESDYTPSQSEASSEEEEVSEKDSNESDSEPDGCEIMKEAKVKRNKSMHNGDKIYVIKSDDYFSNSNQKKALISNNALDKLDTPKLRQDELHKLLKSSSDKKHKNNFQNLEEQINGLFPRLMYLMHEGFNILVYGLGSKMKVLENFHKKYLRNVPVVVVNGFFPSLSIKNVLEVILNDLLEVKDSFGNVYDGCDLISQEMSRYINLHVYLMVHNIEGNMLKNSKTQNVLSRLAAIKNLHLIASVDHVSAPLIWDSTKLSKFNFVWYDVTSFNSYINETSFEGSMIVERSKNLALSSLNNVFLSLTSNSKGIYLLIAKYQLEKGSTQHYQGYLFKDLYWACRESFLVSSDLALRSQLTEFVDHKMVKFRRSADGSEYLVIPTVTNILQQFYDDQSQ